MCECQFHLVFSSLALAFAKLYVQWQPGTNEPLLQSEMRKKEKDKKAGEREQNIKLEEDKSEMRMKGILNAIVGEYKFIKC